MDRVHIRVENMLREQGQRVTIMREGFQVSLESTAVNIRLVPRENHTVIHFWIPVLREVSPSPELFEYVAVEGQIYFFGSLRYVPDQGGGLVTLEHALLGDYLDPEELQVVLDALAAVGERLDEELQGRFGGKRFVDD